MRFVNKRIIDIEKASKRLDEAQITLRNAINEGKPVTELEHLFTDIKTASNLLQSAQNSEHLFDCVHCNEEEKMEDGWVMLCVSAINWTENRIERETDEPYTVIVTHAFEKGSEQVLLFCKDCAEQTNFKEHILTADDHVRPYCDPLKINVNCYRIEEED